MKLTQVTEITNADIVVGDIQNKSVEKGFCSDLMSDVLTIDTEKLLLITGLANVQTIRTAEMADVQFIILVRDKTATREMIRLAEENNMVVMVTPHSMFWVAGRLYESGLKAVY